MPFALKITWRDGGEAWVTDPPKDAVAVYAQRDDALARRRLVFEQIGHLVQAIDVVPAPRRARAVMVDDGD